MLEKAAENGKAAAPATELTRVFDAPRALVFEAWSRPEHVSKWFAPKPLTISSCEMEFRSGGVFKFTMQMGETEFPFVGKFEEVVSNEKIVFSGIIHDDNSCYTVVTFEDAPGNKTKLSVRQTYAYASPATGGAKQGWLSTLDNLAEAVTALVQRK
jgi:uncharacterized protein YndB with AHSA1/START domain